MINKDLPEPELEHRYCVFCGKRKRLTGFLIHLPSEDYEKDEVTLMNGQKCQSFSMWTYECAWCKAILTKRKRKEQLKQEVRDEDNR